jgi:hypothetical protein
MLECLLRVQYLLPHAKALPPNIRDGDIQYAAHGFNRGGDLETLPDNLSYNIAVTLLNTCLI